MSQPLTIAHIAADREFAHANIYKSKAKGGYDWNYSQLYFFLTNRGYHIYRTSVDRFVTVRVLDNIVSIVGRVDIGKEITDFLINVENVPEHIIDWARKDLKKAISDDFLIQLPEKNVDIRRDRKDAMQLYYQNCIVKITATKVTTHPYSTLTGLIWESQILPRQFNIEEITEKSNFATFVSNISNQNQERVDSICSAFGFYLHNYKNASYCPCVIVNDEGDPSTGGGTGKSLFFVALGYLIKMITEDGERVDLDKTFAYQRVTPDTRLLFFDDARKGFPIKKLKSFLTGGITTEKKGKDAFYIPFSESPKVGISTNYGVDNSDNPIERRTFELEISRYYNKIKKPEHEFGRFMFTEWPDNDPQWSQFDNYAVKCAQTYLNRGLVEQKLINLPEKKLLAQTNQDFLDFMVDYKFESEVSKSGMLAQFKSEHTKYNTQKNDWLTVNFFTKWLTAYCAYHNIEFESDKKDRTGNIRVYRFANFPINNDPGF